MKNIVSDILIRFIGGFSIATLIGCSVNMIISASIGGGEYLPVMPMLAEHFDTELAAVLVQFLMIGMIGVTFAEGALIFNIARWSFLLKYVVHFLITAVVYIPFVGLCWFPLETDGILIMVINILFTYVVVWLIHYSINRKNIAEINKKLEEVRNVGN